MCVDMRSVEFLVVCLNLMKQGAKDKFTEFLDNKHFDNCFWFLIERKEFPWWFSKNFSNNALYGYVNGVRECLSLAARHGLLRMDGSYFKYHLDMSDRMKNAIIKDRSFDEKILKKVAARLSNLLLKF